jgi:hypothetical protein
MAMFMYTKPEKPVRKGRNKSKLFTKEEDDFLKEHWRGNLKKKEIYELMLKTFPDEPVKTIDQIRHRAGGLGICKPNKNRGKRPNYNNVDPLKHLKHHQQKGGFLP